MGGPSGPHAVNAHCKKINKFSFGAGIIVLILALYVWRGIKKGNIK
jgi:hypothetical protein